MQQNNRRAFALVDIVQSNIIHIDEGPFGRMLPLGKSRLKSSEKRGARQKTGRGKGSGFTATSN